MNTRCEPRHIYHHRLSITHHCTDDPNVKHYFGRGEVIDWSLHGLHVFSCVKLEEKLTYRVRFHVEKSNGLISQKRLWSREGEIRWIRPNGSGWHLGIYLPDPLDAVGIEQLETYITAEDSCYLFVCEDVSSLN